MLDPNEVGITENVKAFRLALRALVRWQLALLKATHPEPGAMQ